MSADKEILDFMAELNAEFGKKKKSKEAPHKALNSNFHKQNPQIETALGKAPERLNPEQSEHWEPITRETHVTRQCCRTCGDAVEFIAGEYVRFRSIFRFGGTILRRAEVCSDLFLYYKTYELRDVVERHVQEVERCAGCIAVEVHAVQIWETAIEQHKQLPLKDASSDDIIVKGL